MSYLTGAFGLCVAGRLYSQAAEGVAPPPGVHITALTNRLRVEINGRLCTEYYFRNVTRPYCHPLIGPGGLTMTRRFPMEEVPAEEHDHPHHRSLWFAHGAVNGVDFWTEGTNTGKILHDGFIEITSGALFGVIRTRNNWVAPDGRVVCGDERTIRFSNRSNETLLDFEVTMHASNGELVLGDTKEGTMAVRVAETMRLKPNEYDKGKPSGHIVTSEDFRDAATWGTRAAWCDYYGPVEGRIVGIALFDHPQNPRHPTWWHVRDYGLFAANPFGMHDFEKRPPASGDFRIPAGGSMTLRYRVFLHEGDEQQGRVAERYRDYANTHRAEGKPE